ncbi:MAG TPA: response regulator [Bacteroidia bacterium]|nr:response regulator [Bacteroidia bacterium]
MENKTENSLTESSNIKYGISVLMVEDDYINIFMMQKIFESLFDISYAKSSAEALSMLSNNTYDLVLMDINLGDETVTGVDILKKMKEDSRHAQTKTFAVTGYVMEGDREKYIGLGFDEHFPKPLAKETLMEAIERFFG